MNKLHEDKSHYYSLSMDSRAFWMLMDPYIGGRIAMQLPMYNKPIKKYWTPVSFQLAENAGAQEIPDWSFYTSGDLILNEKAKNALEGFLLESGEILPLLSDDGRYYFFNCLIKIEEGQQLPENKDLYKATPTVGIDLICSDAFKTAAEEAQLKGMYFTNDVTVLA